MNDVGTAVHDTQSAMKAGEQGAIPILVRLCRDVDHPEVQRYAAFALANLALIDSNKARILEADGVEALTALYSSECEEARGHATDALGTLADVARKDDLAVQRKEFGVDGMVALCGGGTYCNFENAGMI